MHSLLVEDDPHIADVVAYLLEEAGHRVTRSTDGSAGWAAFRRGRFDLVILDLGLPGLPGLEVFTRIRRLCPRQPVILLTARNAEADRLRGLDLGADDYITKPFSNPELMLRVRNLLRRCPPRTGWIHCGPLELDRESGEVRAGGAPLALPPHEVRLLQALMEQPGRTFTRAQLLDRMYAPGAAVTERAVDQGVARLRRRLRARLPDFDPLHSVYGAGYRLDPPTTETVA